MIIWVCSCNCGGKACTEQDLERQVNAHLYQRGNERHAITYGNAEGSIELGPPPPLVWKSNRQEV